MLGESLLWLAPLVAVVRATSKRRWHTHLSCPPLGSNGEPCSNVCDLQDPDCAGTHKGLLFPWVQVSTVLYNALGRATALVLGHAENLHSDDAPVEGHRPNTSVHDAVLHAFEAMRLLVCGLRYGQCYSQEGFHVFMYAMCIIAAQYFTVLGIDVSGGIEVPGLEHPGESFCFQLLRSPSGAILSPVRVALAGLGFPPSAIDDPPGVAKRFPPLGTSTWFRPRYPVDFSPGRICSGPAPEWPRTARRSLERRPWTNDAGWHEVLVAEVLSPREIFGLLTEHGVPLSNWLFDFGAAWERGEAGTVSGRVGQLLELVQEGMPAVLVEGGAKDEKDAESLRALFGHRADVCLVLRILKPEDAPNILHECLSRRASVLGPSGRSIVPPPTAGGVPAAPDWLKIDVDGGDCGFLREIIVAGYRPLVIQIEVRPYPPPLAFEQHFSPDGLALCPYNNTGTRCLLTQGCSVAAVLAILGFDYWLLQVDGGDAYFVLADIAPAFGSTWDAVSARMSPWQHAQELYRWTVLCDALRPYEPEEHSVLRYDHRLWVDPGVPLEERQHRLEQYLARHARGVDYAVATLPIDSPRST